MKDVVLLPEEVAGLNEAVTGLNKGTLDGAVTVFRGGGSNFILVRQNTNDKKPLDSAMSWNIHPMKEISVIIESWLKSLSVYNHSYNDSKYSYTFIK